MAENQENSLGGARLSRGEFFGVVFGRILPAAALLYLDACAGGHISSLTPAPTDTGVPITPTATEFNPTPAATATEIHLATEQAPYGVPSLSNAEYRPGSGGSNRADLVSEFERLFPTLGEQIMTNHEKAIRTWVNTNLKLAKDDVDFIYLLNGEIGINSRWSMVAKRLDNGNLIWPAKKDNGFLDEVPYAFTLAEDNVTVIVDPSLIPVEIEGTANAEVKFVNRDEVVAFGGSTVTIGEQQYYTQWLNAQHAAQIGYTMEDIPEVNAALEASFPQSILEPLPNDPNKLTTITAEQEAGVESYLRAHPWKFSENATPVVVHHTAPGTDDTVNVRCSNKPDGNVHTVAQYRLLNADGTTEGDYVWFWILGKDANGNPAQNLNRGFIGEHAGEVHPVPNAKRILEQLSLSFSDGHIYITYHNRTSDNSSYYYFRYMSDSYVQLMNDWVNGVLPAELDGKTLVIGLIPGEQKP